MLPTWVPIAWVAHACASISPTEHAASPGLGATTGCLNGPNAGGVESWRCGSGGGFAPASVECGQGAERLMLEVVLADIAADLDGGC